MVDTATLLKTYQGMGSLQMQAALARQLMQSGSQATNPLVAALAGAVGSYAAGDAANQQKDTDKTLFQNTLDQQQFQRDTTGKELDIKEGEFGLEKQKFGFDSIKDALSLKQNAMAQDSLYGTNTSAMVDALLPKDIRNTINSINIPAPTAPATNQPVQAPGPQDMSQALAAPASGQPGMMSDNLTGAGIPAAATAAPVNPATAQPAQRPGLINQMTLTPAQKALALQDPKEFLKSIVGNELNNDVKQNSGYAARIAQADKTINDVGDRGVPGSVTGNILNENGNWFAHYFPGTETARRAIQNPQQQMSEAAAKDWISAKLRNEGVRLNPDTVQQTYETYFPQAEDKAETIKYKANLRRIETQNILKSAGANPGDFGYGAAGAGSSGGNNTGTLKTPSGNTYKVLDDEDSDQ